MAATFLPIWQLEPGLRKAWQNYSRLILVAPTGSGKSTQVCQMLLDENRIGSRQIVVLQPRRVAARTLAHRVAEEKKSKLGDEVGYQIRFEDFCSEKTRVRFMTEGVLLRLFAEDPDLKGINAILFDEFHERNLFSDVALGLALRLQESRRPDLLIMLMSATIDAESLSLFLGNCPVLQAEGRVYPVQLHHLDKPNDPIEAAAQKVVEIVRSGKDGDILIFMPGMGEIQRTIREIEVSRVSESLLLIPLHGDLPPEQQDLAFLPSKRRKIIVATNVAETSVTIDGVKFVIDSGLARVSRFDPATGIATLKIEEISQASAGQRAGRAGRTAPGECFRLWTQAEHRERAARNTPEILRTDLSSVVLLLHSIGIDDICDFKLPDPPDPEAVRAAEEMLERLGALKSRKITPLGREMLRLPVHPRYARMLLEAKKRACVRTVAMFAALTSGRDLLLRTRDKDVKEGREIFETNSKSDFFTLANAFRYAQQRKFELSTCRKVGIHANSARLVEDTFDQILDVCERSGFQINEKAPSDDDVFRCVLAGFADHLAVRMDSGSLECALLGGKTATLARESLVQDSKIIVAAEIREIHSDESKFRLLNVATAVEPSWLEEIFPQDVQKKEEVVFDRRERKTKKFRAVYFRDLLIGGEAISSTQADSYEGESQSLAEALVDEPQSLPRWDHEVRQWIWRVKWVGDLQPDLKLPSYSREDCIKCLARAFKGLESFKEAKGKPLLEHFKGLLSEAQQDAVEDEAPESIELHSKNLKLLYGEDGPSLSLKIEDALKMKQHPELPNGRRIPVCLLTPDLKKLPFCMDLIAFLKTDYPHMRESLVQKFPKIQWP
jgi:ATP-dependent helicase HrpB